MGSGNQSDFNANALGPFGPLFQTYSASLDQFARAFGVPNVLTADLSPATLSQRASAPLKAVARGQLEFLGLMNRRMQAYMQLPSRLAQCRSPQDIVNEQMAFWRTAGQQYAETSRRTFDAWSADAWQVSNARPAERDYINFNGTAGSDGSLPAQIPEQVAGSKQRRVA